MSKVYDKGTRSIINISDELYYFNLLLTWVFASVILSVYAIGVIDHTVERRQPTVRTDSAQESWWF